MAKQPSAFTEEKSVFTLIRELEEKRQSFHHAAVGDVQKRLQSIVDDLKCLGVQPKEFLSDPAFDQALTGLGLTLKSSEKVAKKSKELPPVGDSPLAKAISDYLKKAGTSKSAEDVVKALSDSGKPASIKNYLGRMVNEGLIVKPSRGLFSSK